MALTPFVILVVIALLLTVISFVESRFPLLSVAVLLIAIALLIR